MDDYSLSSLTESKNQWCAHLVSLLTHHVNVGIDSIFNESVNICSQEQEENKYLMTFQNLLSTIPSWNPTIIEQEKNRIENDSGCKYLEDLITAVHIIQLKALTCIRVGQKQKKIDINIPSLDKFIHNSYINVARKLYTNIYLYQKTVNPLQSQKNKHKVELLIKEAILLTIRDSVPIERILQCYMEENEEIEIPTEIPIEPTNISCSDLAIDKSNLPDIPVHLSDNSQLTCEPPAEKPNLIDTSTIELQKNNLKDEKLQLDINEIIPATNSLNISEPNDNLSISFSDIDKIIEPNDSEKEVIAPKDIPTLEKIYEINNEKRKESENNDDDKLNIGSDVSLDLDIIPL